MSVRKDVHFATQLIEEDFGLAARKVFEVVSRRENLTLDDIARSVSFTKRRCGLILYTLLKHDCTTARHIGYRQRAQRIVTYSIDLNQTMCRRRYPRYLIFTKFKYSHQHFLIILSVILHGAMSRDEILFVANNGRRNRGAVKLDVVDNTAFLAAFDELVNAGLLQQAPGVKSDSILPHDAQLHHTDQISEGTQVPTIWRVCPCTFDDSLYTVITPEIPMQMDKLVGVRAIRRSSRRKHVEAVIRARLGVQALRIYRMLGQTQLEQKQVADLSMVPVKDTRDILYKLLKFGYVQMQEIARTNDHAPSRTNYLWRVDCTVVDAVVKRELTQTLTNIHLRLLSQLQLHCRMIQPSDSRHCRKEEVSRDVLDILELGALRLDELLLVFNYAVER